MNERPARTVRAALTLGSSLLLTVARAATTFIVTPWLLTYLGAARFGAFTMLQNLFTYLSLADLRPSGTLKFLLANLHHDPDQERKRALTATALSASIVSLPLFLMLAAITLVFLVDIVPVSADLAGEVASAFLILALGYFLERLLSIPSGILAAQNEGYRSTWWQVGMLVGQLFGVWLVIEHDVGLVGVAAVSTLFLVLRNAHAIAIVIREIPWVTTLTLSTAGMRSFFAISGWFTLGGISFFLLSSAEILLAGILFSPETAAAAAITVTLPRLLLQLFTAVTSAPNVGLVHLVGEREGNRIGEVREEVLVLGSLLSMLGGGAVLLTNQQVISWWVGGDFFLGMGITLCSILIASSVALSRIDGVILDCCGGVRCKAMLQTGAATVTLILVSSFGDTPPALFFIIATVNWLLALGVTYQAQRYLTRHVPHPLSQAETISAFGCRLVVHGGTVTVVLTATSLASSTSSALAMLLLIVGTAFYLRYGICPKTRTTLFQRVHILRRYRLRS